MSLMDIRIFVVKMSTVLRIPHSAVTIIKYKLYLTAHRTLQNKLPVEVFLPGCQTEKSHLRTFALTEMKMIYKLNLRRKKNCLCYIQYKIFPINIDRSECIIWCEFGRRYFIGANVATHPTWSVQFDNTRWWKAEIITR